MSRTAAGLLRLLPPEVAHDIALFMLGRTSAHKLMDLSFSFQDFNLETSLPGMGVLKHPLGLAAGFDKNALALKGLSQLGFSFLEVGTVTPKPQPGNPKPRIFRQKKDLAIINRMGFNNLGCEAVFRNLSQFKHKKVTTPIGVNVGKNKFTSDAEAIDDYLHGINNFADIADYLVINISSPNTPGLRNLANAEFIADLADSLFANDSQLLQKIWIKLDPDQSKSDFQTIVEKITDRKFAGIILSNTHKVLYPEAGGKSGHPLSILSTTQLEWAYEVHRGRLAMIGSGGVLSGMDIFQKMIRGASAVQLYTAFVYRGPSAVFELLNEFCQELKLRGIKHATDIIGSYYS